MQLTLDYSQQRLVVVRRRRPGLVQALLSEKLLKQPQLLVLLLGQVSQVPVRVADIVHWRLGHGRLRRATGGVIDAAGKYAQGRQRGVWSDGRGCRRRGQLETPEEMG